MCHRVQLIARAHGRQMAGGDGSLYRGADRVTVDIDMLDGCIPEAGEGSCAAHDVSRWAHAGLADGRIVLGARTSPHCIPISEEEQPVVQDRRKACTIIWTDCACTGGEGWRGWYGKILWRQAEYLNFGHCQCSFLLIIDLY